VVLIVLAWLLSQVVKLALSRSRELLADAGSVELTKNPDAMISALRKIEGRGELVGATSAVMELCVDNPREGFTDLFATHPSVESRVAALVKYGGGHYLGPLALPMHPTDGSDNQLAQPDQTDDRPSPPPLTSGPWGPADASQDAAGGAPNRPWGNPTGGPWGGR
jgi:heat shock protein HtpX